MFRAVKRNYHHWSHSVHEVGNVRTRRQYREVSSVLILTELCDKKCEKQPPAEDHGRNRTSKSMTQLKESWRNVCRSGKLHASKTALILPKTLQQLQIVTSWQEIKRAWLRETRIASNDFGRRGRSLEKGRSWDFINHWSQSPFPSMKKGRLWAVFSSNRLTFPFSFLLFPPCL